MKGGRDSPVQNPPGMNQEPGLRIRLLGQVTVEIDGAPVAITSRKARALLGYLVQRDGTAVSRATLAGLLWGERSEDQARASLRQTLSELRTSLGAVAETAIIASSESVAWANGNGWIDTRLLDQAVRSSEEARLREAADAYRGDFLEGLSVGEPAFEQWLAAERERLRMQACAVLDRLMGS